MNFENYLDNNTLIAEDTTSSNVPETTSYGLDLAGDLESRESQLNPIQLSRIESLSVEAGSPDSELVFIDSTVEDLQTLTDNISGTTEVIVLDGDRDELVQISEHLSNYEELDAVHIVSHGETGQLSFGNATLNSDTLPEYEEVIEQWSLALDEDADLLLYGCDVTLDGRGNSFVQELNQITDADISASINDTGIDGDWELETAVGEVEADSIFTQEIENAYQHNLADGDFSFATGDLPDFNNVDLSDTSFDFTNVSSDNLTIFAEAGLDFSTVDPSTLNNINFNEVPAEDLEILADAGLSLEPLSPEEISNINLNALEGLNYIEGVELSSIESLSGDTTFAQLSDSVIANANLFNYKNPTLSLESGFTVDKLSQFSQSDFQALDYAFTGDEAFDGEYYLAQNPGIREAGVNPFTHYMETGFTEGRDPNAVFDTSFYLEQNPDVRDAGENPLRHYLTFAKTDGLNRYPNLVFKSFGESSGALVASADLSGSQFEEFKTFAEDTDEVAFGFAPAIPFIIVNGKTILAITAASLGIIATASNIQELIGSSDTEIFVPEGDIDPSTPPFDLGEATRINPESFPNSNDFLDEVLDGQYEFPSDDGEGGAYFLAAGGASGNELGDLREEAVVDLVGGTLAKDSNGQDIELFEEGASASVPIDVFGPNGELILVGGPAKSTNLGKLGGILRNIKIVAEARGVQAQYYFSDNTSEAVIKFTEKRLGAENVFTFPEVNQP